MSNEEKTQAVAGPRNHFEGPWRQWRRVSPKNPPEG